MLQDFNFVGMRVIDAAGKFFLYQGVTAASVGLDPRIRVSGDGTYFGTFSPGDRIRELPRQVRRWTVEPVAAALAGTVIIGEALVELGQPAQALAVVDNGAALTLAGGQFLASITKAANATKVGMAGILAGSKALKVKRAAIASPTAGRMATWFGTGTPTDTPTSSAVGNKLLGGAAALATRTTGLAATTAPSGAELPGGTSFHSDYVQANQRTDLMISTPIVVPAGYWFGVVGSVINADVTFYADLEEL